MDIFGNESYEQAVLRSPFDFDTHKRCFINYFEVVILEDGTIEYAVPCHQEKLFAVIQGRSNETREEIGKRCPPEYYFSFNEWLAKEARALCVWDRFYYGEPNEKQMEALRRCQEEGLYRGELSNDRKENLA